MRYLVQLYNAIIYTISNKTFWTGVCLCMFLVAYTKYQLLLSTEVVDGRQRDLFKACAFGGLVLSGLIFYSMGVNNRIQESFLTMYAVVLVITCLIIALTQFAIIIDPYYFTKALDIGVFFVTLMIIISGGRHGYFKDEY